MKILLFLSLTVLVVGPQAQTPQTPQTFQTATPDVTDLVVVKFSAEKYVSPGEPIRPWEAPASSQNGPSLIVPNVKRDDAEAARAARELAQRRGDAEARRPENMKQRAEKQAAAIEADAAAARLAKFYVYQIQIKNAGKRLVRSFVWEYQGAPGVEDSPGRQFLCAVKAKPNQTKGVEVMSGLPPSAIVDASKAGDKQPLPASATINRIEYSDGSIWQRRGWNPTVLSRVAGRKIELGRCVGL